MSEAFITRRGGGGMKLFAVISVTYPAGSVCTCTKGTKTYKAKNTSGLALFAVPEVGDWIVSCTDGTQTASKTVTISAEGQSESVRLAYFDGTIYDAGTVNVEMEVTSSPAGVYSVTYNASSLTFKYGGGQAAGFLSAKVDVTDYSTLKVTYKGNNVLSGVGYVAINDTNTVAYNSSPKGSSAFYHATPDTHTGSLDISSFTGEYYVGIWDRRWDQSGSSVIVYKIWME